nr:MAG TPA: hypothetical protein [Caudoviricetes sp.]
MFLLYFKRKQLFSMCLNQTIVEQLSYWIVILV